MYVFLYHIVRNPLKCTFKTAKIKTEIETLQHERRSAFMSILVTGGTGYIGSHTCVELLDAGYDVVVIDNYYNSKPEVLNRIHRITGKDVTFCECDIRDRDGLSKIFETYSIDAVIHFAGLKSVGES